ncbi:hypothetical protein HC251_06625 [Iamia sp. SCSIO 61187]|uniref:BTAD domain-containing putative transcriptional regulator n=1 Tax=Iamia sp. SCSIO 61187 TaxID=2722752 RepID=UPI001C639FB4|nr:BTAD domain-containing putative transcriptional regulator [Iamia sp. SCSIO 61187]QYG92145.1 hypothetical protein HC251_06625 [Iamia sp. SCSIO 61187]
MRERLEISLLGPVSVRSEGGTCAVRSRPQRTVLARLALEPNRVVSAGTLIDVLWGHDPPPNATGNLHSYVSKLRRLVGPDRIRREHGGYRLEVDPDAVDTARVERLAAGAEELDAPGRAAALGEALALWVGEPLADLDDVEALVPDRMRLAALRHELDVRRMAALVDAGDHVAVLPRLREAAAQDAYDETIVVLLARALHGAGRTAEALRTLSGFRRHLREGTGLDPSSELTRIEQSIVHDDPALRGVGPRLRGPAPGSLPATAEWPRFATPLHGREEELVRLDDLVGTQPVVTVTGTGGIGKSRLACAVADRRSGSGQAVHFLPLAALAADDDLPARLAAALGVRVPGGQDPVHAVHRRIGSGGQLLVLDSCEHVLDPVRRLVEALLARRSDLTVLTTSRTPLGLTAECVVRIGPLAEAGDAGCRVFLDRARRVRPGFRSDGADEEVIRSVVRGLGGLPLAIELAAGRMASMSLRDLAARIDDLDLLTDGRPTERHRTLRAAIDWSYRLLPEPARRLLRTLSAFPGGADLATVEELAPHLQLPGGGASEVVALAEASLLDAELERSARYAMLEPVRAFARERLDEAQEAAAACSLRAAWARRTAAWIEDTCRSPDEAVADARLRSDVANLRVAHRTARLGGDLDTAIAISAALTRPATARDLPEVWSWALDLVAHPALPEHQRGADGLGAAATAAWLTGDLDGAARLATDGLRRDPTSVACLQALGSVRLFLGQPETARQLWVAASRPHGAYLPQAALAAVYTGDADLARRSLAAADAWAADVGSPTEVALCRYAWGELLGPDRAALGEYEESIALASGVGATFVASISRVGLASTLAVNGHHRRAIDELVTVIRYWRTTGNWTQQWTTLRNVAALLDALGRPSTAAGIRAAAARASAAAAEPGALVEAVGGPDPRPAATPETLVALVLAELTEVRREVGPDAG